MPKYDLEITGMGLVRFANNCTIDSLISILSNDLRNINFKKVTITIDKKRGKGNA